MKVVLTGATGYLGSSVLAALRRSQHEVIAVVRSADSALKAEAAGAVAVCGDLTDRAWLTNQLRSADAAIHTASPHGAAAEALDDTVATAVIDAFSGTTKRYLHTSGLWIWGAGSAITESTPLHPPRLARYRIAIEQRLLDSPVSVTIPAPGTVYGGGRGLTRLVTRRLDDGKVRLIGDGEQRWSLLHVDDLGSLYVAALEAAHPVGRLIATSGETLQVREIAERASRGSGTIAESPEQSRERLGVDLADALLMDQCALGGGARTLGWRPAAQRLGDMM